MAKRVDIISPAILVGFLAFCLTSDPKWFALCGGAAAIVMTLLIANSGTADRRERVDPDSTSAFPAE